MASEWALKQRAIKPKIRVTSLHEASETYGRPNWGGANRRARRDAQFNHPDRCAARPTRRVRLRKNRGNDYLKYGRPARTFSDAHTRLGRINDAINFLCKNRPDLLDKVIMDGATSALQTAA